VPPLSLAPPPTWSRRSGWFDRRRLRRRRPRPRPDACGSETAAAAAARPEVAAEVEAEPLPGRQTTRRTVRQGENLKKHKNFSFH
jgi:hypothetical protein